MAMNDQQLAKKFLYANGTLKNKFKIQDATELQDIEYKLVAQNSIWLLQHGYVIKGMDDFAKIHRFLFGDIYDWAGKLRNYYLTKADTDFMPPSAFDTAFTNIQQQLDEIKATKKPSVAQYVKLLDSLNYLHPFREGNGRTTRLFIQLLAANHHQYIEYHQQTQEIINALNNSNLKKLQQFISIRDMDELAKK